MKNGSWLIGFLAVTALCVGVHGEEDHVVGEKWIYAHEGPRPNGGPDSVVKGDRTVEVTAIEGEGEGKLFVYKTQWGENDPMPTLTRIDSKSMVRSIQLPGLVMIEMNPPLPAQWETIGVGETETFETNINVMGYEVPLVIETKRLEDETISVPAGTFENCRRIESTHKTTDETGNPVTHKYLYWFHDGVKHLVKETFTNNVGGDAYSGTSSLKKHIKPE